MSKRSKLDSRRSGGSSALPLCPNNLSGTKDLATRARLRQKIRRKVARIDFWFRRDRNTPHLVTNSKKDLFPFARVTFTNGQQPYIVLVENGFVTLIR
jgi:hypothetical protein